MTTRDKLATAQWVFERTLGWIAAAEVKVGVIVTLDVAMMGGLAALYASHTAAKDGWIHGSSGLSALLAVAGVVCAAMAVKPRLDGPKRSLLFFGRVKELSRADYVNEFKAASDEALLVDWLEQIHRNSEIAVAKHGWVGKASLLSFASAAAWIIAVAQLVRG